MKYISLPGLRFHIQYCDRYTPTEHSYGTRVCDHRCYDEENVNMERERGRERKRREAEKEEKAEYKTKDQGKLEMRITMTLTQANKVQCSP